MTTLRRGKSRCEIPKQSDNLRKSQKNIFETNQCGHSDYPRMLKGLKSHCNAESISPQEKGKVSFFISSINWLSEKREKV